jgi:ketosteroid isomerase-like protein
MNDSNSTAEVIHRFVAALGRADAETALANVADNFELTIHTAPRGVPRTISGKEELAALVGNIGHTWTQVRIPRIEVHPFADDSARALAEYDVAATNHDDTGYRNGYIAIGHVERGLITRFDEYYDPEPMIQAINALRAHVRAQRKDE